MVNLGGRRNSMNMLGRRLTTKYFIKDFGKNCRKASHNFERFSGVSSIDACYVKCENKLPECDEFSYAPRS